MEFRVTRLNLLIEEYKAELLKFEKELHELIGMYHSPGTIHYAKNRLDEALRREQDATAIPVVFSKQAFNVDSQYVVHKITTKRIFIRQPGSKHSVQFCLNGTSPTNWKGDEIDIRETFGIDADEVPPNYKTQKLEVIS